MNRDFQSVALPLIGAGTGGGREAVVQRTIEDEATRADYSGRVVIVRHGPAGHP